MLEFQPSLPPMLPMLPPPVEVVEFDVPEILGANDWAEVCEAAIEAWQEDSGLEIAHLLGLMFHGGDHGHTDAESRLRHTMKLVRDWQEFRLEVDEDRSRQEREQAAGARGLLFLPTPYGQLVEAAICLPEPGGRQGPSLDGSEQSNLLRWAFRLP